MMPSLLAHLAFKFTSRHEDLATEALAYILRTSEMARGAFINYLNEQFHVQLPNNVRFQAQQRMQDNTIPDLVGFDGLGRRVVIVEAKFWAGLTDNQPAAYLRLLPANAPGLLVFIAPAARFRTLWPELIRRCGQAVPGNQPDHAPDSHVLWVNDDHRLGLTSWRDVLNLIDRSLEHPRDNALRADVQQLEGLCNRMDSEAFLPLASEELSSQIGRRVGQYCDIINDVVDQLVKDHVVDTVIPSPTTANRSWGRSFLIRGNYCDLCFLPHAWARYRETPLWLVVRNHENQTTPELRTALHQLELETPSRLVDDENRQLVVPIFPPTGVEREEVILDITRQISKVAKLLPPPPGIGPAGA
jgi:hypothetical protein